MKGQLLESRTRTLPGRVLTLLFTLLSAWSTVAADTHYVSKSGSNASPYTSWATATGSIKLAIEAASAWDTVKVGPGVYVEDSIQLRSGMVLSGAGSDSTTIEIAQADQVLTQFILLGDSSTFEHFLIQGILSESDRGVVVPRPWTGVVRNNVINSFAFGVYANLGTSSTAEISSNTLELCRQPIVILGGFPVIQNNRIYPPSANSSINTTSGAPIVEGNVIGGQPPGLTRAKREAFYGASEQFGSGNCIELNFPYDLAVRNNIMWGEGRGVYVDNNSIPDNGLPWGLVENNTCVALGGQGIRVRRSNVLVRNNIVANAGHLHHPVVEATLFNIRFEYNLIWDYDNPPIWGPGNTPIENVFAEPMFLDSLNFHLQAYSPAIDAGDTLLLDQDGSRSDIGAYGGLGGESYAYLDLPPGGPAPFSGTRSDTLLSLIWGANNEADLCCYEIYRDTAPVLNVNPVLLLATPPAPDTIYADAHIVTGAGYFYRIRAIDAQNNASVLSTELNLSATRIKDGDAGIKPRSYELYQNYPNPFNSATMIHFSVSGSAGSASHVHVSVHNVLGRNVRVLYDGIIPSGEHRLPWNGRDDAGSSLASGVYFIRLTSRNSEEFRKMLLLR